MVSRENGPSPRKKKQKKFEMCAADKARREEYERRMAMAESGGKSAAAPTPVVERRLPPGIFEIDFSKFGPTRSLLIERILHCNVVSPVLLFGQAGRGKSSLAAAVYLKSPELPVWMTFLEFADTLKTLRDKGEYFPSAKNRVGDEVSRESFWERLENARFVFIDDIGAGDREEIRNEGLRELIDRRKGGPLILTSNLSPDNSDRETLWTKFDERVMSRITGGECIRLGGHDLRAARGIMTEVD